MHRGAGLNGPAVPASPALAVSVRINWDSGTDLCA